MPFDNRRLVSLCGKFDEHLHQIEHRLNVEILNRGNAFQVAGKPKAVRTVEKILTQLYQETDHGQELTPTQVHLSIQQFTGMMMATNECAPTEASNTNSTSEESSKAKSFSIKTPTGLIAPKTKNQKHYVKKILSHDINFGIGPAGTGKTFLAVACAVAALEQQKVRRIILVRPVVEAGERLGFLPGDLTQKIDPYLRPLYDALYEMLGPDKVVKLLEQQIIEIAPLAYMRGRTLNDAFIILDESQNTTVEQMKMFLTRIGFSSTAVITGDITQIDLARDKYSGLRHAREVLKDIDKISFTHFEKADVVRHPLVQDIIEAYEKASLNGDSRDH